MNENIATFLVVATGALMGEIYGIGLIKLSHRSQNPMLMKRYGKIMCILGIFGFILGIIGLYIGV